MANCDNAYIGSQTTMLGGIYCCSSLYASLSNSINGAQSPRADHSAALLCEWLKLVCRSLFPQVKNWEDKHSTDRYSSSVYSCFEGSRYCDYGDCSGVGYIQWNVVSGSSDA